VIGWLANWVRTPVPQEVIPGQWEIQVPPLSRVFFRCDGKPKVEGDGGTT
jgi:hypothetical protein